MTHPAYFEREHQRLDAELHAHLLELIGADFCAALTRLQRWRAQLARHIAIEEAELLPHVPEGARWAARVYRLEHERIALLAQEYEEKLRHTAAHPPQGPQATREAVLALLDAAHALRHVIEHHHEREEKALAEELAPALQAAAWGAA